MIIETEKYCIATKDFPLQFDDGEGNSVSDFRYAHLDSYEYMKSELEHFDEPENFQILKVKVTYEF